MLRPKEIRNVEENNYTNGRWHWRGVKIKTKTATSKSIMRMEWEGGAEQGERNRKGNRTKDKIWWRNEDDIDVESWQQQNQKETSDERRTEAQREEKIKYRKNKEMIEKRKTTLKKTKHKKQEQKRENCGDYGIKRKIKIAWWKKGRRHWRKRNLDSKNKKSENGG